MVFDLKPVEWISLMSFALALGSLIARFITNNPSAKEHFATAALVFLVLAIGVFTSFSFQRAREIERMEARIVAILGDGEKTRDAVVAELDGVNPELFNAAFEALKNEERIQSRFMECKLTQRQTVSARFWSVKPGTTGQDCLSAR